MKTASIIKGAHALPATLGDLNSTTETVVDPRPDGWGWLPVLFLINGAGLLTVSIGYTLARSGQSWAGSLFWLGLLMIFVPTALRIASTGASRKERIGLVTGLGLALYVIKVLHSPVAFTFNDEFVHWRTVDDIIQTHHLFNYNPIIPVSPLYPALHIITSSIMNLTGLDVFGAGIIVLAIARLLIMLALYLFFEEISMSPRIAGIAVLLYMANSNFVFFSAEFSYESLSLPLACIGLFALTRRMRRSGAGTFGYTTVAVVTLLAVVTTHHLTAYAIEAFLIIWAGLALGLNLLNSLNQKANRPKLTFKLLAKSLANQVAVLRGRAVPDEEALYHYVPLGPMLLMLAASLLWIVYVASYTVGYLAPVLQGAVVEIFQMIAGEKSSRQLFTASTGQVAALWEQLIGYGSVALILMILPIGLWAVWRFFRNNPVALTLALIALVYPVSLALRLTSAGWEISNRTSEFIFIAVAFVLATGIVKILAQQPSRVWVALFTPVAVVLFLGGIMLGWPPSSRIPGPYLVSADTRSVEAEGITAAQWANTELGPDNRIATDRINALLMLSYGDQYPVLNNPEGAYLDSVFFSSVLGPDQITELQQGKIRYVVVDKRLSTALPLVGIYIETGEPDSNQHKQPIPLQDLTKFDQDPRLSRVFDSGDIVIYDVRELSGVR